MKDILHQFNRNEDGSIAPALAAGITAILIGVGVALDFSAMSSKRAKLQDLTDAATIAAALSGETTQDDVETFVADYLAGQIDGEHSQVVSVDGGTIRVELSQDHDLMIVGKMMPDQPGTRRVKVTSEAPMAGGAQMDITLVLDTTKSMEGERITALKEAAKGLIDTLDEADPDGTAVRVAVVPFADYVRIDTDLAPQPWLQVAPDRTTTWNSLDRDASTNCVDTTEGETTTTTCENEVRVDRTATETWVGCMGSRPDGHHVTPAYASYRMQGIVGSSNCGSHFNVMSPLSDDLDAARDKVDGLNIASKTYMPAGLIWGWRTLNKNAPFTQVASRPKARRVMIVMSDGSNTTSLSAPSTTHTGRYHWGEGDEPSSMVVADALTESMCTAIKLDGIQIITIAFQIDDNKTRKMLRECASHTSEYHNVEQVANLDRAFQRIGNGLTEVRLLR